MREEPSSSREFDENSNNDVIDLKRWDSITPFQFVSLARRLTIASWLMLLGVFVGTFGLGLTFGTAYIEGQLPQWAYLLEEPGHSPRDKRLDAEHQERFVVNYGRIVDWQTLSALANSIAMHRPDGLDGSFETAVSILAQVRGTRGTAYFLSGETQLALTVDFDSEAINFEWEERPSIIPRVAADAGYELSDDELRTVNSNLNWAQFSYLDDAMKHAVVFRELDGSFRLTLRTD